MQKGTLDMLIALNHIKIADAHFFSARKDNPKSRGGQLAAICQNKTTFIVNQITTYPAFNDFMRSAMRDEIKSDPYTAEAVYEKLFKLAPASREAVENLIDKMLKGESLTVELTAI